MNKSYIHILKMFCRLFDCCKKKNLEQEECVTKNIQWSDTLQFTPPINCGHVIKVYDGNTFIVAAHLAYDNSPLYRFTVLLKGVDCSVLMCGTEQEKQCAIFAREELETLILEKKITLKNIQNEKYGRILADIFVDGIHVNQHMIDKKLVVPYDCVRNSESWLARYKKKKEARVVEV
jgi:endonuclease YncB( thermonuclease family)